MTGHSRNSGSGRTLSIVVGAIVVGVVGWVTLETNAPRTDVRPAASASATASSAPPVPDAGPSTLAPPETNEGDGGLFLPALSLGDAGVMPASAPRSVKIGVVVVSFAGAEGAAPNARSKKDALAIAERLGADAKTDFHRAVAAGDSGSDDNIGRLPRGVLDPRTEIAVFALGAGEISDVLETPRGYWIVKRIE